MTLCSRIQLFTLGVGMLAIAWLAALPDHITWLEEQSFRWINDLPNWIEYPGWPVMQLGSILAVPLVVLTCVAAFRKWSVPVRVAAAGGSAWILAKVIKDIVARGRPDVFLSNIHLRPMWTGFGFPSGHSAVALAIAVVLGLSLPRRWRIVVWITAGLTGLMRIYTAAHFPLDVIGGWGLGLATGSLAAAGTPKTSVFRTLDPSDTV